MSAESERILLLARSLRDARIACEELAASGMASHMCASVEAVCQAIEEGAGAALLPEDDLDPGAREQLAATLANQPTWSDFPLLVLAARRSVRHRSDGLDRLGNVTLLDRPLRLRTLTRAARAALRARRRQYAAARAIDQRDRFLAMLGHELRNPLSAIALAVERAQSDPDDPDRALAIIDKQVGHLGRLVDDLLDVSRVTAGKVVLQRARVDVGALLQGLREVMGERFADAGIGLTVTVDGPMMVVGDELRLEQVLGNLLSNALKYTPAGGEVRAKVAREVDEVVVTVEDTGVGIPAEVLPRVFDTFVQADDSLARSEGGLGVGLALVRGLVDLHGGRVSAASDGTGRGARFEVRLPRAPGEEARAAPSPAAPGDGARGALSVVLVDDHEDSRELLAEALSLHGHDVTAADTGEAGLAAILDRSPHAAIVDLGLPDIDGFEVARRARARLGASVRLVALTGYGLPEDSRRSAEAGFDEHLTKPASLAALLRAVAGD